MDDTDALASETSSFKPTPLTRVVVVVVVAARALDVDLDDDDDDDDDTSSIVAIARASSASSPSAMMHARQTEVQNATKPLLTFENDQRMTNGETPADASKKTKGDLSYHYWHGRNTGEAPAATAKVRTAERTTRVEMHFFCIFF